MRYTGLPGRYELPGFPKKACSMLLHCTEKSPSWGESQREYWDVESINVFERLVLVQECLDLISYY